MSHIFLWPNLASGGLIKQSATAEDFLQQLQLKLMERKSISETADTVIIM